MATPDAYLQRMSDQLFGQCGAPDGAVRASDKVGEARSPPPEREVEAAVRVARRRGVRARDAHGDAQREGDSVAGPRVGT